MYQIAVYLKPVCEASLIEMLVENGFKIYLVNSLTNNYSSPFDDEDDEDDKNNYSYEYCFYKLTYNGKAQVNLQDILKDLSNNPCVIRIKLEITTE